MQSIAPLSYSSHNVMGSRLLLCICFPRFVARLEPERCRTKASFPACTCDYSTLRQLPTKTWRPKNPKSKLRQGHNLVSGQSRDCRPIGIGQESWRRRVASHFEGTQRLASNISLREISLCPSVPL